MLARVSICNYLVLLSLVVNTALSWLKRFTTQ